MIDEHDDEVEREQGNEEFLRGTLRRFNEEFEACARFLEPVHERFDERYAVFNNAKRYQELIEDGRYPSSFMVDQVQSFVADTMDKLWFKDSPCKVVPGPDTTPEQADQKQHVIAYQSDKMKMKRKCRQWLKDVAMTGICVSHTDYRKNEKKRFTEKEGQAFGPNPEDPKGDPIPLLDEEGLPIIETFMESEPFITYMGPWSNRIDPKNFFYSSEDGLDAENESARFTKSFVTKQFFRNNPDLYVDNFEDILQNKSSGEMSRTTENDPLEKKRMLLGFNAEATKKKSILYIERHGLLDKRKLWKLLGPDLQLDRSSGLEIDRRDLKNAGEHEKVLAIVGVFNGKEIIRIDTYPFERDNSVLTVGMMDPEDDELIGGCVAEAALATTLELEQAGGALRENLYQSIKAGHVINTRKLATEGTGVVVNEQSFILEVTDDVDKVHRRIEQPNRAPELLSYMQYLKNDGQARSGISAIITGGGDPNSETLGETEIVANRSSVRVAAFREMFEETFIEPLYELQDDINQEFLDDDYLVRILGDEGADEWKRVSLEDIRAGAEFKCQSASREANRSVVSQQTLGLLKVAANVLNAGQPARLDKMAYDLAVNGMSMDTDQAEEYFPLMQDGMEELSTELNKTLAQNAFGKAQLEQLTIQMQAMQMQLAGILQGGLPGGEGAGAGEGVPLAGGNLPDPNSDRAANQANQQASRTQTEGLRA